MLTAWFKPKETILRITINHDNKKKRSNFIPKEKPKLLHEIYVQYHQL